MDEDAQRTADVIELIATKARRAAQVHEALEGDDEQAIKEAIEAFDEVDDLYGVDPAHDVLTAEEFAEHLEEFLNELVENELIDPEIVDEEFVEACFNAYYLDDLTEDEEDEPLFAPIASTEQFAEALEEQWGQAAASAVKKAGAALKRKGAAAAGQAKLGYQIGRGGGALKPTSVAAKLGKAAGAAARRPGRTAAIAGGAAAGGYAAKRALGRRREAVDDVADVVDEIMGAAENEGDNDLVEQLKKVVKKAAETGAEKFGARFAPWQKKAARVNVLRKKLSASVEQETGLLLVEDEDGDLWLAEPETNLLIMAPEELDEAAKVVSTFPQMGNAMVPANAQDPDDENPLGDGVLEPDPAPNTAGGTGAAKAKAAAKKKQRSEREEGESGEDDGEPLFEAFEVTVFDHETGELHEGELKLRLYAPDEEDELDEEVQELLDEAVDATFKKIGQAVVQTEPIQAALKAFADEPIVEKGPKFIKGAIKRPGQLHRDLGVPQGQKIPVEKIRQAAKRKGPVGFRARFALRLRKLRPKGAAATKAAKKAARTRQRMAASVETDNAQVIYESIARYLVSIPELTENIFQQIITLVCEEHKLTEESDKDFVADAINEIWANKETEQPFV